ncbi:MAG: phage tail length tape measure family protein [Pseudodonghicola sp.]
MSAKDLLLRLIFRADAREAKAATKEVQAGIADVTATTKTSTAATDQDTAATAKNAQARRDAAKAAQDQAVAERAAREAALRATTGTGTAPRPPQSQDAPGLSEADKTAIRARYVPMAAADQAYRKEVDELAAAAKSGALSADEVAQAQARVQTRYDHAVEAIRRSDAALSGNSRNMKLSAFEARNLSYQINDVVQSLMMGMPAQQVLMQQGPQITQIYGGVGNTFRALRSVLTPTRLLLGGVSAAAITGATAWNQYLRSTMAVTAEMDGLGRGLARSPAELEAAARAGAAAAGISIRAAREMQVAFLHTGRIRSEHYADLIAISKDFAATMGIDAGAAGGALAEMFADPAKAADTLYGKYGLIDAATARYVRNLAAQNRESEAQGVLLDRLPEKLANAEDRMHALDRAMQGIKNTASGLWDGLGEGIDRMFSGPTLDEEISKAEGELDRLEKLPKNRVRQSTIENARARLSALMEQRRVRDAAAEQAQQRSEAERLGRKAITIAEGSGATSRMRQEQDLRNEITALDKGKDAPGLDAFQQQEITQALEAKRRVLDALIGRQDRLAQLDRLEVQISAEKNPMIRAELEARRTRLQMAQEEVAQGEIDSAAARARQKVIEQTVTSTKAQATELTAEAEIRARLTAQVAAGLIRSEDVNRLLQEELTLRPLVAAAAAAEGEEKKRLADVVDALRDAYRLQAQTMADARATDYLLSERERVAELRLEVALLGQSERVRARVLAQYQAEQKIRELGATGERAEQIRREAVANADRPPSWTSRSMPGAASRMRQRLRSMAQSIVSRKAISRARSGRSRKRPAT